MSRVRVTSWTMAGCFVLCLLAGCATVARQVRSQSCQSAALTSLAGVYYGEAVQGRRKIPIRVVVGERPSLSIVGGPSYSFECEPLGTAAFGPSMPTQIDNAAVFRIRSSVASDQQFTLAMITPSEDRDGHVLGVRLRLQGADPRMAAHALLRRPKAIRQIYGRSVQPYFLLADSDDRSLPSHRLRETIDGLGRDGGWRLLDVWHATAQGDREAVISAAQSVLPPRLYLFFVKGDATAVAVNMTRGTGGVLSISPPPASARLPGFVLTMPVSANGPLRMRFTRQQIAEAGAADSSEVSVLVFGNSVGDYGPLLPRGQVFAEIAGKALVTAAAVAAVAALVGPEGGSDSAPSGRSIEVPPPAAPCTYCSGHGRIRQSRKNDKGQMEYHEPLCWVCGGTGRAR